jgi:hypothetical protein
MNHEIGVPYKTIPPQRRQKHSKQNGTFRVVEQETYKAISSEIYIGKLVLILTSRAFPSEKEKNCWVNVALV